MNIAIIPAGGAGKRMGTELPKQFEEVCGKPLIVHALRTINAHEGIDRIVIGCLKGYEELLHEICQKWDIDKLSDVVEGGATRQATVCACLEYIAKYAPQLVLIHDAARPLVSRDIITENLSAAVHYGAVNTVVNIADTIIKSADGKTNSEVVDRRVLYKVQTPQTFKYETILKAHQNAFESGDLSHTDDCALCVKDGVPVFLVHGSTANLKITTPDDLELFKAVSRGGGLRPREKTTFKY